MYFKSGTKWASFQNFGFGYPYAARENTIYISLKLVGMRKEAFNRFLREKITFLGVAGYTYLEVSVDENNVKDLKQCFEVNLGGYEVQRIYQQYIDEKLSFEKFYDILLPYIFTKSFGRSRE